MFDNRNLILAIVLSLAILFGFELLFPSPQSQLAEPQTQTAQSTATPTPGAVQPQAPAPSSGPAPVVAAPVIGAQPVLDRAQVISTLARIKIDTPRLSGSIALKGARIDDLIMTDYRETLEEDSPPIVLLSPEGAKGAYFAEFGWSAIDGGAPGGDAVWQADRTTLTPEQPVTLTWNNGQGLLFKRTYAIDSDFLFTITQTVQNTGPAAKRLYPYALASRHGNPETTGFYILHEGLLGVFDGQLKEVDYDEVAEAPDGRIEQNSDGGWLGITDKYWLVALAPEKGSKTQSRFVHTRDGGVDKYQTDTLGTEKVVAPGGSVTVTSHLFAGAKEVTLLDRYEVEDNIARFDLSIDFGWFYFLTKPIFYMVQWLYGFAGNFGVAILLLTVALKLVLFPLANKSYVAMSKMRKLQPEMLKLRDQFKDDKMRLNQEMMALYKREKANPASGCLPMIVQIPIFFALYKVLFVSIEMRHAPFFGWIQDLSAPDPTTIWNLFGLLPWDASAVVPDILNIGIWPLIMGFTMWLQQRLNPQPTDPIQAKVFAFLPIMFTFMLATFPAGLVIYWAWNNILSITQQKVIMMRMGVK